MNQDIYYDAFKTVVRMCSDIIDAVKAAEYSTDIQFVNFEEHSTIYEMPATDVIGIGSFQMTMTNISRVFDVTIAISTINDQHLFRHNQIANLISGKFMPGVNHPMYDAATGLSIATLTVAEGTQVKYVERTDKRNIRLIFVALSTPAL